MVIHLRSNLRGIGNFDFEISKLHRLHHLHRRGERAPSSTKVLIGGGRNHIMGLFDMVMIKDNHILVAGGVKDALNLNYSSIIYHEGTYQDAHQGSSYHYQEVPLR
ncbi:unnamed protein product [Camellia sinensis]